MTNGKPPPFIKATARPVRIAYVIEEGPDTHQWLGAVFSECFGRHGGRQTLVVPLINGDVSNQYITWLKEFDPDILYLLTFDDPKIAELLASTISPTYILGGKRERGQEKDHPRISLESEALSSLSWLPFLKVSCGGFQARPEEILDSYPRWQDDGLITDNFGTLQRSFSRFPLSPELKEQVHPLILTPSDAPADRWHFSVDGDEITDAYEALNSLTQSGRNITLAYLSNLYSKHISIHSHPWLNSFCLVVGDSFEDRISCWNGGLLFDDARHQAYKTLRVPSHVITNDSLIDRIANFIQECNWLGQSNSPPHITVRSYSLDEATLRPFVEQLRKSTFSIINYEHIDSVEDCCPDSKKNFRLIAEFEAAQAKEVLIRDMKEAVPTPQSFHLAHANMAHPVCSRGQWMVDYRIDRINDNNRYANVRDTWQLPKRQQIIEQFSNRGEGRITDIGTVSVMADKTCEYAMITQPLDADFFWSLLHRTPSYMHRDLRSHSDFHVAYKYSRLSDKGRYLKGVLGLFQSLGTAVEVLGCHFWRNQFVKMAAPSEDQWSELVPKLKKKLRPQAGRLQIENDDQWENLARVITRLSASLRMPKYNVKLSTFKNDWIEELTAAIDTNDHLKKQKDELLAEAEGNLNSSLEGLCRLGIFYQGHTWSCSHCGYRNWNAIDKLSLELSCQVCHEPYQTPVDLKLAFRLNEFFASCLREHDTLTVIWALGELQSEAKASFIFSPQLELLREYPGKANAPSDREIDLLCIVDGKIVIGEVKNSLSEINSKEIDALVELANELRPNVVVLAALSGEQPGMDKKLQDIRPRLPANVEAKGLLGSRWDDQPSVFLPVI